MATRTRTRRTIVAVALALVLAGVGAAIALSEDGTKPSTSRQEKVTFGRMPGTGIRPASAVPDFVAVFDRATTIVGYLKKEQLLRDPTAPQLVYARDGKTVVGRVADGQVMLKDGTVAFP